MATVASRELRNSTRALLDRVSAGEAITITLDGRVVGVLSRRSRRPRSWTREELVLLSDGYEDDPAISLNPA